jgi:hypothetical protein
MTESQELPAPPRLIPAMVAGFDAIANHILLITFPLGLDLLIWLAPHLRLKVLIETFLAEITLFTENDGPELTNMIEVGKEVWLQMAERINLIVAVRSYPFGVPSLMTSSLPLETPMGAPKMLDIKSAGFAVLIFLLFIIVGLVIGSLYYSLVSQAAILGDIQWKQALLEWPRTSLQVILLALIWAGLFFVVSIPASCLISVATLAGFSFGQFSILLYGGFLIWLIFPLLFSAHGIFANHLNVLSSIRTGIRMTNATLSNTVLFVVSVIVLTQGLDMLWRVPPADSWLTLLGISGHAFVVTGLLSASFVYYHDAQRWINRVDQQIQMLGNSDN